MAYSLIAACGVQEMIWCVSFNANSVFDRDRRFVPGVFWCQD
jgi:hypothetical protein